MTTEKTVTTHRQEMFSDEHLRALEKQFIEKYKGNEKHPIRALLSFYKGYYGKLEGGRCVEYGTYDELMEKKGAFYAYRQLQI